MAFMEVTRNQPFGFFFDLYSKLVDAVEPIFVKGSAPLSL
jgi:hypothetical protein